jgi:hypothetical protein
MAYMTLTACITYKWWVKPFMYASVICAWLIYREPDWDKIIATASKGIILKLSPEPFTAKG